MCTGCIKYEVGQAWLGLMPEILTHRNRRIAASLRGSSVCIASSWPSRTTEGEAVWKATYSPPASKREIEN